MYPGYVSPFLVYNTAGTMARSCRCAAFVTFSLMLAACAAPAKKPLVDPFPLRFPLVEAGTLAIEGHIIGQPWAEDGVVTFATDDGFLMAVVVPAGSLLWRHPGPAEEEGSALRPVPVSGPVQSGPETPLLRVEGDRLRAFDAGGGMTWEFAAAGTIASEPEVLSGRIYFGTEDRWFYCLKAATGKAKWRRRLQGAPLHPAVIGEGTVAVPASNSVVYFLSARGGSILTWENVPSRVLYPLAAAGPLVLVSAASQEVTALEIGTGKRVGQYLASGPLVAGAVWSPPYVVLFVEDAESGGQRIVFLRSR
jgi:outer membrane protein assembly factor BamB